MGKKFRIIVSLPVHPIIMAFYIFLAIPLMLVAQVVISKIFTYLGINVVFGFMMAFSMIFLSLMLSPFNILLKEIATGIYSVRYETRYVSFFGIPIPVIDRKIVENKILVAMNIGGAVIPILISSIIILRMLMSNPNTMASLLVAILVTALITYIASKPVPGVGIAVPTFIPPIIASLMTLVTLYPSKLAIPGAYVAGTLGCLVGADVLRFIKDKDKLITILGPTVLSIGGAGTFDGIYLSGILATLMTLILT